MAWVLTMTPAEAGSCGHTKEESESIPQKNKVMLSTAGATEKGNWVSGDILRSAIETRTEAARSKT